MYFLILIFTFLVNSAFPSSHFQKAHKALESVLSEARKSTLPPLVQNFCRMITHGEDDFKQVNHVNFNVLMSQHYVRRWYTDSEEDIWRNNVRSHIDSPIENFHKELCIRFDRRIKRKHTTEDPESFITYPGELDHKDHQTLNSHYLRRDTFVDGHQILLKDFTLPFPLLTVAFFDRDQAKKRYKLLLRNNHLRAAPKVHNWFVPLEQALLMTKKEHFLNRLALLNGEKETGGWGLEYTWSALGLIRKGKKMTASIGPVNPQFYQGDLARKRPGGATQLFVAKIEEMEFVDIDVVKEDGLHFIEVLSDLGLFLEEEKKHFLRIRDCFDQLHT